MSAVPAHTQFIRYALIGVVSNLVLYLGYIGLTLMGIDPKLAMSLLYGLGVVQTFTFNKRWSFGHQGAMGPAFFRYCVSYGLGFLFNLIALFVLVDRLGYPHRIVQAVLVLCTAVLLFTLQKLWVFRRPASATSAA